MNTKTTIAVTAIMAAFVSSVSPHAEIEETLDYIETKITSFHGYDWGTSFDKVFENEVSDEMIFDEDYYFPDEKNILMVANVEMDTFYTDIIFYFDEEYGLYHGTYLLQEENSDPNYYYSTYLELQQSYANEYGNPSFIFDHWLDDIFKDDFTLYGVALSFGSVSFSSSWMDEIGDTISVYCSGFNNKISNAIIYGSKYSSKLQEKNKTANDAFFTLYNMKNNTD